MTLSPKLFMTSWIVEFHVLILLLSFDFNCLNNGALQLPLTGLSFTLGMVTMVTNVFYYDKYFVLLSHI